MSVSIVRLRYGERDESENTDRVAIGRLTMGAILETHRFGTENRPRRLRMPSDVEEIVARAVPLLGTRFAAIDWLTKPSRWLNDRSPLAMIEAGQREDVSRYLSQVEYGVYV